MNTREIYLLLGTACFAVCFVAALYGLKKGNYSQGGRRNPLNLTLIAAGFVFQTLFLYAQGMIHGRCPLTSGVEVLMFVGWSLALIYLLVGSTYRLSLLGVFTAPVILVFNLVGFLGGVLTAEPRPAKGSVDPWVELHAAVSLISYGAFALAAVAGIMFLVQERKLKNHKIGGLFYYLPPIGYLSGAIVRLVSFGFLLLTVGVLTAFAMSDLPAAVHLIVTIVVWIAYGVLLAFIWFRPLNGRPLARSAFLIFSLPLLSLWALNVV